MKKATLILALLATTFFGGCMDVNTFTHNGGYGMLEKPEQRKRRIATINDYYGRQLMDDWDEFWFYDETLNLTEWNIYRGY